MQLLLLAVPAPILIYKVFLIGSKILPLVNIINTSSEPQTIPSPLTNPTKITRTPQILNFFDRTPALRTGIFEGVFIH